MASNSVSNAISRNFSLHLIYSSIQMFFSFKSNGTNVNLNEFVKYLYDLYVKYEYADTDFNLDKNSDDYYNEKIEEKLIDGEKPKKIVKKIVKKPIKKESSESSDSEEEIKVLKK